MLGGGGASTVKITCGGTTKGGACNYNCGARPQGFMRPRLYSLEYTPDSDGILYLPFIDNDAWNRDYLCNKRGIAEGDDLAAARLAAHTGDAAFFDTLLGLQPELRLELEWQITGIGTNTTQTLALRVSGTAPSSYVTYTDPVENEDGGVPGLCHPNPLREAPGSSGKAQKDLTKTVHLVRNFFDPSTKGKDPENIVTPATKLLKSTCRPVPEVEELGGESLIPMACAHGLCTKMCCSPMKTPDDTVVITAPMDNPAEDGTARIVMDKDGIRIIVRAQWRAARTMQSMRPGADLVDQLWPPPGSTPVLKAVYELQAQRYRHEGARMELNHLGNLQLTIGSDSKPVFVWGERLDVENEDVWPWCEDLMGVPYTTEDEKAITSMVCRKYENMEPIYDNNGNEYAEADAEPYTATTKEKKAAPTEDATDCVPGGATAVRDQHEHQRGAQRDEQRDVQRDAQGTSAAAPQCIIASPAGAPPCRALRQAGLARMSNGGYVDPAGGMGALECEGRAKRWARVCGWPLPVKAPNPAKRSKQAAQATLTGTQHTPGGNNPRRSRRPDGVAAEASIGSFISGVGSAAKSVGGAVGGVATDAAGMAGDAVGAVGDAAGDAVGAVGGALWGGHSTGENCFDISKYGVAGGRRPIVFQVTQFEDPANDVGDTRTTGTALLRHGDVIRSNHIELVVLNSKSVPVLTVLDTPTDEDRIVRRPLVVGGTVFDHKSWPAASGADANGKGPQTYTVEVTHTGLRLTAGADAFALKFVQSRMLAEKQIRAEWKSVAALLLPVPADGPTSEYTHVTASTAVTGMGAEVSRYWSSATSTTLYAPSGGSSTSMISSGAGGTATTTTTTTTQLGDAPASSIGYSFGADGGYSLLESDHALSPDFMDDETSTHRTEVGTYYAARHSERSNAWRQNVIWGSIGGGALLLGVLYHAATAAGEDEDEERTGVG
jgi:hypothetical protein